MYIMSNVEGLLRYASKSTIIEIKPKTVTFVDESVISFEELQGCYGTRIFKIEDSEAEKLLASEVVVEEAKTEIIDDVVVPVANTAPVVEDETLVVTDEISEPVIETAPVEVPVVEDETLVVTDEISEPAVETAPVEVPVTVDVKVEDTITTASVDVEVEKDEDKVPVVEEATPAAPVVEEVDPFTNDPEIEDLVIGVTQSEDGEAVVDAGELFSAMQKKEKEIASKTPTKRRRNTRAKSSKK